MSDVLVTDVLVVGEGCAGQTAALTASESGCDVIMLGDGRAPSTAVSTGFLTYAAHEGFNRAQLYEAMSQTTGKGLCDVALLRRLVDEAPKEMAELIETYKVPVDNTERGVRARRAVGKSGKELLSGLDADYGTRGSLEDTTGLMMEFSSTHGTALYAQLRKAVNTAPKIRRVRGSALVLEPGSTTVGALVDGEPVTIAARSIILATGGIQGLYEVTDNPHTLTGDGHGMAMDAGAEFVDMEFMQFYPLSVNEEGAPTLFFYPDFPRRAKLIDDGGRNVLVKHLGEGSQYLSELHNWDQLAAVVQTEIVEGRKVFVDFRETKPEEWAPDSLTGTFLGKCVPNFMTTPVQVAPSSHYTIGGLKVDVDGRTNLPKLYAVGELAGGVHGANRHGGTALVDAMTYGRIAGRHAAGSLNGAAATGGAALLPAGSKAGKASRIEGAMSDLRRANQLALGPIRDAVRLQRVGELFAELLDEVRSFGWNGYKEMQEILRVERAIKLSDAMRQAMLRRTETRGVHYRADFPSSSDAWLKKQVFALRDGALHFKDVPL
uniref:L-aspartate oxidase n=1 Tax=Burkholderia sp. WS TaxID=306678 RepID=Q59I45_9BURK|nr:2-chloroacrylate-inducible protein CAA67 [Burkholderia sp. WS]